MAGVRAAAGSFGLADCLREGLVAGEQVVTEGAAWLEDGATVNVLAQSE